MLLSLAVFFIHCGQCWLVIKYAVFATRMVTKSRPNMVKLKAEKFLNSNHHQGDFHKI